MVKQIIKKLEFRNSGHHDPILFVRENCFAHWSIVRMLAEAESKNVRQKPSSLGYWLKMEDVVLGDPHLRNIESRLFGSLAGEGGVVDTVFNDADDSGSGPLAGDLLRLTSASLAEKIEIDSLPKTYLKGLLGKKIKPPKVVKKYAHLDYHKFLKMQDKVFKKELDRIGEALNSGGNFNFNGGAGQIKILTDEKLRLHLQGLLGLPLYERQNVCAFYSYIKKSGGSGGDTRYWVLAKSSSKIAFIFEYKPLSRIPGVAGFKGGQRNPLGRYQLAFARMYRDLRFQTPLQLLTIDGVPYLLRAKFSNPLKHGLDNEMSLSDKGDLANYAAYMLGRFHRHSPSNQGEKLAKAAQKNFANFKEVILRATDQINKIMEVGLTRTRQGGEA